MWIGAIATRTGSISKRGWYQAAGDQVEDLVDCGVHELKRWWLWAKTKTAYSVMEKIRARKGVRKVVKLAPQELLASFFIKFTLFPALLTTPCRLDLNMRLRSQVCLKDVFD